MKLFDLLDNGPELRLLTTVNQIWQVLANHWLVGWNDNDIQFIDFMKLFRFSKRGTSHTCQFFIQTEVVLKGDRGKSVIFTLDLDAFFGLDGLMQTFAIAAPWHLTPSEFVNDDDFAILDDIVLVALEDDLSFDRILHIACQVHIALVVDVTNACQMLNSINSWLS